MIAQLALASLLVLGAAPDPCAPVEPATRPDPAEAEAYRAVGDAERAAGAADAATVAYRAAVAHGGGDGAARAALAALCAEQAPDPFYDGVQRMRRGDRRGAIAAFERARGGPEGSAAALLQGVCLYEEGDDEAAAARLRDAESDPAHRESARFFLGLVALRAGRAAEAEDLLARSAGDPALAPFARDLVRSARRTGRVVLSFVAESGWDSNVDLAPAVAQAASDGVGSLTTALELRPHGDAGPFLRATGNWREQARHNALDMWGLGGAAGWQGEWGGAGSWLAEYGYDRRDLARAPYLSAHRLLGSARLALGDGLSGGAAWLTRFETFAAADDAGYSGTRHVAEVDLAWRLGPRTTLTAAFHAGRDLTRDAALSWWQTGPRLALRFRATARTRLGLDGGLAWRRYGRDPTIADGRRRDLILDLAAAVERDLADRWTLRASAAVQRQASSERDFRYTKVVPMIGIGYTVGVL